MHETTNKVPHTAAGVGPELWSGGGRHHAVKNSHAQKVNMLRLVHKQEGKFYFQAPRSSALHKETFTSVTGL